MDDRMDLYSDGTQQANEYAESASWPHYFPSSSSTPMCYASSNLSSLPQSSSSIRPASHAVSIFSSDHVWNTPASSVFEEDFVSQVSQDIQDKVDSLEHDELFRLQNVLQKALLQVNTLIKAISPREEPQQPKIDSRYRCLLCPSEMQRTCTGKGTFKRHVLENHYPQYSYRCPDQGCANVFHRKDKFRQHMRAQHHRLVGRDLTVFVELNPHPKACPICHCFPSSWDTFFHCILGHCCFGPIEKYPQMPSDADDEYRGKISTEPSIAQRKRIKIEKLSMSAYALPKRKGKDTTYGKAHQALPLETWDRKTDFTTVTDDTLWESSKSEPSSAITAITTPEAVEELSIDAGMSSTGDLEAILNPTSHNETLCALEMETARLCCLHDMNPEYTISDDTISDATSSVGEYISAIAGCREAFHNLHNQGFCGDKVIMFKHRKDGIAESIYITLEEIDSLASELQAYHEPEPTESCVALVQYLVERFVGTGTGHDFTYSLHLLYKVLSVGIVSFSGSHACAFDVKVWGQKIPYFYICSSLGFSRQQLACLDAFVGGHVWVFGAPVEFWGPDLILSLTVEDLQQLWGPIWMVGGTEDLAPVIRTERGYIVPVAENIQRMSYYGGILCHWSEELPDRFLQEKLPADHILMSKTSRLVIGLNEDEHRMGITVNERCQADANLIQRQLALELRLPGTSKARYVGEGYEVSIGGGYNSNIGLVKKWKRMPARTHKSMLISHCTSPNAKLLPILRMRVGLEVSACTGNSRRISLWDAIQLSRICQAGARPGCTQQLCSHPVGDIDCINLCWERRGGGPLDDINDKPLDGASRKEHARREVINAILALEYTGVDHEGYLQTFWPFSDCPQVCRIKSSTRLRKNNWLRMVKDTPETSTFAVLSQRCLCMASAFPNVRLSACPQSDAPLLPTALSTQVFIEDLNERIKSEIAVGNSIRLGETSLETVGTQPGYPQLLVAAVRRTHRRSWIASCIKVQEHINQDNLVGESFMMISY